MDSISWFSKDISISLSLGSLVFPAMVSILCFRLLHHCPKCLWLYGCTIASQARSRFGGNSSRSRPPRSFGGSALRDLVPTRNHGNFPPLGQGGWTDRGGMRPRGLAGEARGVTHLQHVLGDSSGSPEKLCRNNEACPGLFLRGGRLNKRQYQYLTNTQTLQEFDPVDMLFSLPNPLSRSFRYVMVCPGVISITSTLSRPSLCNSSFNCAGVPIRMGKVP